MIGSTSFPIQILMNEKKEASLSDLEYKYQLGKKSQCTNVTCIQMLFQIHINKIGTCKAAIK